MWRKRSKNYVFTPDRSEQRRKAVDELTRISQELGLYDYRKCWICGEDIGICGPTSGRAAIRWPWWADGRPVHLDCITTPGQLEEPPT